MFTSLVGQFKTRVLQPIIDRKMDAAGKAWVLEARRLVPVDTGQLRDSIGYTYNASTQQLNLYADKHYAIFQEYGTRRMPAHPFMRPALNVVSAVWKGSVNLQFPGTAPKYHQRFHDFKYRIKKGANIQVGHGRYA